VRLIEGVTNKSIGYQPDRKQENEDKQNGWRRTLGFVHGNIGWVTSDEASSRKHQEGSGNGFDGQEHLGREAQNNDREKEDDGGQPESERNRRADGKEKVAWALPQSPTKALPKTQAQGGSGQKR
jgi:hypothetical protein